MAKAINVKIPTAKLIKALETRLDELTKLYEANKKKQDAFDKEMEAYRNAVADACMKHFAKAENVRINERAWSNVINIDFDVPMNLVKVKAPKAPTIEYHEYQYNDAKNELGNAIRMLKMTDEEVVSTSTYNAVAHYL